MNQFNQQYPVVISQNVIWGDMDAFEHVNNTVYFRYFEDVRIAYFEQLDVLGHKAKNNIGPILAKTECNFKLPLKYPDSIHIAARTRILSAKKFEMDYAVYSESYDAIVAEGNGLNVYYDYGLGKSCEIPDSIVTTISNLEKPFL